MKLSKGPSVFERGSNKRAMIAMLLLLGCEDKPGAVSGQPSTQSNVTQKTAQPQSILTAVPAASQPPSAKNVKPKVPLLARMASQRSLLKAWDLNPAPSKRKDANAACPADMVNVADEFCVDRYESSVFDKQGRRASPFYHPSQYHSSKLYSLWQTKFAEDATQKGLSMPIPVPDSWQLALPFEVMAVSKGGALPSGHINRRIAQEACQAVSKRLCSHAEWKKACRGEEDRKFPYGDQFRHGKCNVFRFTHPIQVLHSDGTGYLNDPRLNLVEDAQGQPLLERTGSRPNCVSRWGKDGIYDMVGNLDEWVDDTGGRFVGGFYSRSTKDGCEMSISSHPASYFDYSIGIRCCRDLVKNVVSDPYEDL